MCAVETTPPPRRSLLPQEHGAWGQLFAPLLTALALGRPGPAAISLATSAVLGFLAYEPALVVLGQRGARVLREDGPRAGRRLTGLALAALAAGGLGLGLAPPAVRWAALPTPILAAAAAAVVSRRLEFTLGGEIVIAVALSSVGLPVALAAGARLDAALAAWATWILAFTAATLAVQVLLARARSEGRARAAVSAAGVAGTGIVAAALAARGILPGAALLALAPPALVSFALCVLPVPASRLKEVGWTLMGASLLTVVLLAAGLH